MSRTIVSAALLIGLGASSVLSTANAAQISAANVSGKRPRLWTDDSGNLKITAAQLEVRGDRLAQLQTNGKSSTPPIARLSAADRAYLATLRQPAAKPAAPGEQQPTAPAAAAESMQTGDTESLLQKMMSAGIPSLGNLPLGDLNNADAEEPVRLMYVVVSRKFFESLIPAEVHEVKPVRNRIAGTTFAGHATTTGRNGLEFLPNRWQATFALRFTGTSVSDSVGGDRVQIYSRATTSLDAMKRVVLDETGIHAQPTQTTARSATETLGLSTELPGLRGSMALRIASRRVETTRTQADAESTSNAQSSTSRELDHHLEKPLAGWNAICQDFLVAGKQGKYELATRAMTTADRMQLVIYRKTPGQVPAEPLPAPIDGGPQVAVWIHSSLIKRVMSDASLQQALQPLLARLSAQTSLAGRSQVSSSNYQINWTNGGKWMTVGLSLPADGADRMAAAQK